MWPPVPPAAMTIVGPVTPSAACGARPSTDSDMASLTSTAITGTSLDLSTPRRIHVVGVGGSGMSAIASVLRAMGHRVSGSDASASPVLDRLRDAGVDVHAGHDASSVASAELVVVSTAIPTDDAEVVAARAAGIPVLRRADVLAAISSQ